MKRQDLVKYVTVGLLMMTMALPAAAQLKNTQNILKNTEKTAKGSYDVEQRDLSSLLGSVVGNFLALLGTAFVEKTAP